MLVFDKEAILQSIKDAGNEDKITQEILDFIDNGQKDENRLWCNI